MHKLTVTLALLVLGLSKMCAQIVNIESLRNDNDTSAFKGIENFNANYKQNTRELFTLNNQLAIQIKKAKNSWLLLNNVDVELAQGQSLEQNLLFHARYNRRLSQKFDAEVYSQYQKNVPLKISDRVLLGAGVRWAIQKKEKAKVTYGLSTLYEYEREMINPIIHNAVRLSNYLSLTLQSKKTSWSSVVYYQPRIDWWEDYRVSLQTKLELKFNADWSFTSNLSFNIDSKPVVDASIPNQTIKWLNGLTYRFKKE